MSKFSIESLIQKKLNSIPITMLTAYSYPLASIIDSAGVDIVLVGDSLANVILGLKSTTSITMDQMLYHTKAVRRAIENSLLIADMPFKGYQINVNDSLNNAKRFVDEAGCDGVKVEWFNKCPDVVKKIASNGINVMAHIGLTPQTADKIGGFKVQGRDANSAKHLIEQALLLEDLGAFSIVLECVPDKLAKIITGKLKIPTIGIGAGADCDGQVLVTHDLLGFVKGFRPKFVKEYVNLHDQIKKAINHFKEDVEKKQFPTKDFSYTMDEDEIKKIELG